MKLGNKKSCGGFTLLEVMVSVAVLGFIMTLVWATTSQGLKAQKRVKGRDEVYHHGTVALRKLSDDLTMAFLAKQTGASPAQTGTEPTEITTQKPATIKTFLIGSDKGDRDEVSFTSFSHLRLFKNERESDQCKVAYEMVPSKEGEGYDLVRREDPWLNDSTEVASKGTVIAEGVGDFNLEYYDMRALDWKKEWDSEKPEWQDKLPLAVKITISFPDKNDERNKISMSTAVTLPLSKGVIEY